MSKRKSPRTILVSRTGGASMDKREANLAKLQAARRELARRFMETLADSGHQLAKLELTKELPVTEGNNDNPGFSGQY